MKISRKFWTEFTRERHYSEGGPVVGRGRSENRRFHFRRG